MNQFDKQFNFFFVKKMMFRSNLKESRKSISRISIIRTKTFMKHQFNIKNLFLIIYTTCKQFIRKLSIVRVIIFLSSIFISLMTFLYHSLIFIVKTIMIMKIRLMTFFMIILIVKIVKIMIISKFLK